MDRAQIGQTDPVIAIVRHSAMDVLDWLKGPQQLLELAVFVIPVFRGRTLIYGEMAFEAEGDFCDAYDGAADDSIALLNVTAAEVPQADISRLMVRGVSRGGNVALLVAVAVAQSAPTDFYRQEVADHYEAQYRCQFLTGKTEAQSRQRMLASSLLRFPMKPPISRVYIEHGEPDDVVPLWNAADGEATRRGRPPARECWSPATREPLSARRLWAAALRA